MYEEILEEIYKEAERFENLEDFLGYVVFTINRGIGKYTWVGVYWLEGEDLVLKAWSGPEATEHTRIRLGEGICGAAALERTTILVPDVSKDPRYIACFPSTKSEIVVPIMLGDSVLGEIDVDSDYLDAFTDEDRRFLEKVARLIAEKYCAEKCSP